MPNSRASTLARLYVNYHPAVETLVGKTRADTRTRRCYDRAQTPYQLLCALLVLSPATRAGLDALYHRLDPLQLCLRLERESRVRRWGLEGRGRGQTRGGAPGERR
jgi:hypothetical protein